jgi:hypothetical protein
VDLHVQSTSSDEDLLLAYRVPRTFFRGRAMGLRTFECLSTLQAFAATAQHLAKGGRLETYDSIQSPYQFAGSVRSFHRFTPETGRGKGHLIYNKKARDDENAYTLALQQRARAAELGVATVDGLGDAVDGDCAPMITDVYPHCSVSDCKTLSKSTPFFRPNGQYQSARLTKSAALAWAKLVSQAHSSRTEEENAMFRRQDAEISAQVVCRNGLSAHGVCGVLIQQLGEVLSSGAIYVSRVPQIAAQRCTTDLLNHMLHHSPYFKPGFKGKFVGREGRALVWAIANSLGYRPPGIEAWFTRNPLPNNGIQPLYFNRVRVDFSWLRTHVSLVLGLVLHLSSVEPCMS